MLVSRFAWLAMLALCCGSCISAGSTATQTYASTSTDDPVHDSAGEWGADRGSAQVPPPVARPALPIEPNEPPPELREFTEREVEAIRRVQRIVHAAARSRDLPPDLVNGIIWVESKFNPKARGHKGPRGLMQLMPRTGRELARQLNRRYAPHDPDFNIHAGTYYFARMVERYDGNLTLALAAYNIGPAHVDDWVRDGLPLGDASRNYVTKVFTAARAFRSREP